MSGSWGIGFSTAAFAFLIAMAGTTMPTPLYPIYEQTQGYSPFVVTLIYAVYAAGVVVALLVAGPWSDQLGRKPLLLSGTILSIISDILFLQHPSLTTILAGRVFSGLSAGIYASTATVAIMELIPKRHQRMGSLVSTGANVFGLGVGPVLAGICASYLAAPLFTPFAVHMGLSVVALVLLVFLPETVQKPDEIKLSVRKLSVSKDARKVFVPAAIAAFAAFMLTGFVASVGTSYVSTQMGYDSKVLLGCIAGLLFLTSAIGQLGDGYLPEHLRLPVGSCILLAGLLVLLASLLTNLLWVMILGMLIGGLGFGIAFHSGLGAVAAASPEHRRAEAVATYFVVAYVAISVPVLGIGIAQLFAGLRATSIGFALIAIVLILVALVQLFRMDSKKQ